MGSDMVKNVLKINLKVMYRVELGKGRTRWEGYFRCHFRVDLGLMTLQTKEMTIQYQTH